MWCNTPEQFTLTWNKHADAQIMLSQDRTAGNYKWTAIPWQIGRLMKT